MPAQPMNGHRASAHFTPMPKPSEILFDETQKMVRIRTSPTEQSWKTHHGVESGTVELPVNGRNNETI
jgi:hypothetical protein